MVSPRIFISYRRTDTQMTAGRLAEALAAWFGRQTVFRDKLSIDGGDLWDDEVDRAISRDTVVLALIGDTWANIRLPDGGGRRLDQDDDPIRLELERALVRGATIIPILVDGATVPKESDLPQSLVLLRRRNFARLRDDDWDSDLQRLLKAIAAAGVRRGSRAWLLAGKLAIGAMLVIALAAVAVKLGLFPERNWSETFVIPGYPVKWPVTTAMVSNLETKLRDFQAYLREKVGFDISETPVGVKVERGDRLDEYRGFVSVYDPEKQSIVISSAYADDAGIALRDYAHHVLDAPDSMGPEALAIESGLASYFACSFDGDPQLGEQSAIARADGFVPWRLDRHDRFDKITLNDPSSVQTKGSAVWGGAFWELRESIGQERVDAVLRKAWADFKGSPKGRQRPIDFVRLASKPLAKPSQADAVRRAFADRGIPVDASIPTDTPRPSDVSAPATPVEPPPPGPLKPSGSFKVSFHLIENSFSSYEFESGKFIALFAKDIDGNGRFPCSIFLTDKSLDGVVPRSDELATMGGKVWERDIEDGGPPVSTPIWDGSVTVTVARARAAGVKPDWADITVQYERSH